MQNLKRLYAMNVFLHRIYRILMKISTILANLPIHDSIIFTKFLNDWVKIVDFSIFERENLNPNQRKSARL